MKSMYDELTLYSSLPDLEEKNARLVMAETCDSNMWAISDQSVNGGLGVKPLEQVNLQPFDQEPELVDGGYDLGNDLIVLAKKKSLAPHPEVTLVNVIKGVFAVITGWHKNPTLAQTTQSGTSDASFLGPETNGESNLHLSVYMPSAPPLSEATDLNRSGYKEVLEAEPPDWLPDSACTSCMSCNAPFTIIRGRHHCRFCGGIFCQTCTIGRCLLPAKFRERDPQRVCNACYDRLDPLQGLLINSISNAMQVAKHDVMDWTSMRGWLNMPVCLSMEQEIYKASNTLRSYCQIGAMNQEKSIPPAILKGAEGLAILTVAKAGMLLTYKLGTGLVVVRRSDGSWSAPSAILSLGLGWGAQVGGGLTDFIIVLYDSKAVQTFCRPMHFSLGAGLGAAAGPLGRVMEADLQMGTKGSGMCYTYSCSKGAFVGVSLEGNIIATRTDTNLRFYGDPYITTNDILQGMVASPIAAEPLYSALRELYLKFNCEELLNFSA